MPGAARGDSVQFSFDAHPINAHTVDVFLKETATGLAEVIAAEGGLDFAGLRLEAVSPPASRVQIAATFGDAAFDVTQTLYNGSPSNVTFTLDAVTIGGWGRAFVAGRPRDDAMAALAFMEYRLKINRLASPPAFSYRYRTRFAARAVRDFT